MKFPKLTSAALLLGGLSVEAPAFAQEDLTLGQEREVTCKKVRRELTLNLETPKDLQERLRTTFRAKDWVEAKKVFNKLEKLEACGEVLLRWQEYYLGAEIHRNLGFTNERRIHLFMAQMLGADVDSERREIAENYGHVKLFGDEGAEFKSLTVHEGPDEQMAVRYVKWHLGKEYYNHDYFGYLPYGIYSFGDQVFELSKDNPAVGIHLSSGL